MQNGNTRQDDSNATTFAAVLVLACVTLLVIGGGFWFAKSAMAARQAQEAVFALASESIQARQVQESNPSATAGNQSDGNQQSGDQNTAPGNTNQPQTQQWDRDAGQQNTNPNPAVPDAEEAQVESITFGGGCFWCTEAVFQQLEGVLSVESGYCNGYVVNPTYQEVCAGTTGHAEVIRINYDPTKVEIATLLEVFFKTHDPTTLNQQGADRGTQYRSGVFFHSGEQAELARLYIQRLNEAGAYPNPIVTEVTAVENYSKAEDYHQNYFQSNPGQGYCRAVIQPKMDKFREAFADKLKAEYSTGSGN